jgi:hypothetical protein
MSIPNQSLVRGSVFAILIIGCCLPACGAINVLMVTTNNGSLTALESGRKSMVESWGYTVNTIWDGAPQAAFNTAFTTNRAVYLPDEATAAEVGYKLREATIGIVSEHPDLADELGFCSGAAATTTSTTINVVSNSHYVTGAFATGNLSLGSGTYNVVNLAGSTASGGQVLATVGGINSVVAIETGAIVATTYNSSNVAFGRRVQFPLPISINDGSTFNANPYTLGARMLWWAAGLDRALVAHWKVDETSGTTAADSSSFVHNATYIGSPTLGISGPHRFAAYFTADGKYVTAPASTLLNTLGASNADFSVAFWVKPNTPAGGWRPLLHKGSADSERGPGIWLNTGTNRIHFRISTTSSWNEGTDSVANLTSGAWSHVACVKAGNKWRCYVNGVLDTEFTLVGTTTGNAGPLYFGDDPWFGGSMTSMDDVRIYNGALTIAEIKKLYGFVGRWKLDETTGTAAADSSSAGNAGTYTNGTQLNQLGIIDIAAGFDGVDDYVGVPDSVSLKATESVTMAAWIRPSASTNLDRMIINKEGEYELAISNTNEIKWAVANTSPGWAWHQTGKYLPNDAWSHVVVTYDGVEAKTYLNGELVETFAANGNIGDAHTGLNELRIGGRSNSPAGKNFAGIIDDVYVYTRPINAAEVANLYGFIGHWKFNEGTGSTAADSTPLLNPATLSGGASWTSDCSGNNNALLTNGTGGIAQTGAAFAPPAVGTVAFWMQSNGAPVGTARVLGLGGDWEIRQSSDGRLSFDLCGDATPNVISTVSLAAVGRWYHVAETFDSVTDTYSIYIDGQLDKTGTNSNAMSQQAAAVLSFGTRTGSTEYWNGALRDVRVYSRKLPPAEIAELYGLVGHWALDETSGATAADSSGLGRNGSVVGTATWTTGKIDNAIQLNGTNRVEVNSLMGSPKNVTLAGWANLTAADSSGAELLSIGNYFALRLNDGTTTRAFFYNGSTWVVASTNQTFTGAGWHHFAGVFNDDANYCKLYVDGIEVASVSTTVTIPWSGLGTKTMLGTHGNGSTNFDFSGKIDDVRVYNRALCPAEVLDLKNGGGTFGGVKIIKWNEIQ